MLRASRPARSVGELERKVPCQLESTRVVSCGTDCSERRGSPYGVRIAEESVVQGVERVGLDNQLHLLPRQPKGTLYGSIDVPRGGIDQAPCSSAWSIAN